MYMFLYMSTGNYGVFFIPKIWDKNKHYIFITEALGGKKKSFLDNIIFLNLF